MPVFVKKCDKQEFKTRLTSALAQVKSTLKHQEQYNNRTRYSYMILARANSCVILARALV